MSFSISDLFRKSLLRSQVFSLSVATAITSTITPVEAQQICDSSNSASYGERPTATRRTVELLSLGVTVAIPENYRTMLRQDGSVEILHPSDFDMIQCISRGGRGGHGIYSERIGLVEDDSTMDLREQAAWLAGTNIGQDGSKVPNATQIIPYERDGLSGYVVASDQSYSYSANFLGIVPGQNMLLKVSASCDCPVGVEAILELLPYVTVTR